MDWETLHSFRVVAREQSFTRAAQQLFLSPSTLSHRIRRLEKEFGARLLSRTTRRVAITEGGETLLAAMDRIEAVLVETRRAIAGVDA
jgi:DNA-binding transcriptional LysR family regulator